VLIVLISIQESMVRQYQESQGTSGKPQPAQQRPPLRTPGSRRPAPLGLDRRHL
jgi:hypothetical protein